MKICCFIYSLGAGGAERVMANLANHWVTRDHEITIVTYDEGKLPFFKLDKRVKLLQLKLSGGSLVRRLRQHIMRIPTFRKVIKETKPDIVISFIDRTNVLVLLASLRLDTPTIVSEHIDPRHYDPGFPYSLLRRIFYRRSSAVVALSEEQANWFTKFSKNVLAIPNPVIATNLPLEHSKQRKKKIIAAGRLAKQKGFDILIEAFSRSTKDNPEWKLEIYGEGPERQSLEKQIHAANLSKRVSLLGLSKNLELRLRNAGFFVLSSRFEGFPCVLLEALANQCPPVAVNCTDSICEILKSGENGIVVPSNNIEKLAEAMGKMMSDEKFRLKLAKNGPKVTQRFSIESVSNRWETLFKVVIR